MKQQTSQTILMKDKDGIFYELDIQNKYIFPNIKKFNVILNAAIWNKYLQDVLYSKLYAASNQSETMYSRGRLKRLFKTLEKLNPSECITECTNIE